MRRDHTGRAAATTATAGVHKGVRPVSRDYEGVAEKFWNLPTKGEEESKRETLFMDDIIQKAHLDREIDALLPGVRTVLDAGAGVGRFSVPLAKRGLEVTHLDISDSMLAKARDMAEAAGVADRMAFVKSPITELAGYPDEGFDLVICLDAPVSYVYPKHNQVLGDLVRIARKAVVVSVAGRLAFFPYWYNPAQKHQYLVDPDDSDRLLEWYPPPTDETWEAWRPDFEDQRRFLDTGLLEDPDAVFAKVELGETPWPITYCFLPEELARVLRDAGLHDLKLSGPGALSRSIPQPLLKKLLFTPALRQQFLDICYEFDSHPSVCGMGKDTVVASGVKK
jgi:SAM-dependent methyltransferase